MTTATCTCGATVYAAAGPDGRRLLLDPAPSSTGQWQLIHHRGRTRANRVSDEIAADPLHRHFGRHACDQQEAVA
jgi:hypothetical protein